MNEKPIYNPLLTEIEQARIQKLDQAEIKYIDDAILSCVTTQYLKQARIVMKAEEKVAQKIKDIPHTFYTMRIQDLKRRELLESRGNLNVPRLSEIRKKQ